MIRSLIEEAAALASLTLFIGMVVIWAQVDLDALTPPCDRDAYGSRPRGFGAQSPGDKAHGSLGRGLDGGQRRRWSFTVVA